MNVMEFNRKVNRDKSKLIEDLEYLKNIFSINVDRHISNYDKWSEDVLEKAIKLEEVENEFRKALYEADNYKLTILQNEGVNLFESVDLFGRNKNEIIDKLSIKGFISSDLTDRLKGYVWDNRYRKSYSD